MVNQAPDNSERDIEDEKQKLGIDEGIVEDGRAMGKDLSAQYVKSRFDPGLAALFKRLAPPPPPPSPPKGKEGHDAGG
jgi:hypothetical protein